MCFCLKIPYLIYIIDSLTLNSCYKYSQHPLSRAPSYNPRLNEAYLTHVFSPEAPHSPVLRNTALQHDAWGHCHQQRAQKSEKSGTK